MATLSAFNENFKIITAQVDYKQKIGTHNQKDQVDFQCSYDILELKRTMDSGIVDKGVE